MKEIPEALFQRFRDFLHHLEDEELQIVGLGDAPEDGVVRGLLALLDLLELDPGVPGGGGHHPLEAVGLHEVGAGAGGQIPAAG